MKMERWAGAGSSKALKNILKIVVLYAEGNEKS